MFRTFRVQTIKSRNYDEQKNNFSAYFFKHSTGESDVYMCNECKTRVKAKTENTSKLRQHLQAKHKRQHDEIVYTLQIFQVIA